MERPLISILLPAYNVAPYLERCIASLIKQTYGNIEIIIVNDGSTDGTGLILDAFSKSNEKLKAFHTPNRGVSEARNMCLAKSSGEYLIFVDPDDYISIDMVEKMYNFLDWNQCDLVVCGANFISTGGKKIVKHTDSDLVFEKGVVMQLLFDDTLGSQTWGKIFKKKLWEDVYFTPGRVYAEDVAVMHYIFDRAVKIGSIAEPLYYYMVNDGTLTTSYRPFKWMSTYLAFKERLEFAEVRYPNMIDKLNAMTINLARLTLDNYLQKKEECDEPFIEEIEGRLKESCRVVLKSRSMKFYNRLMVVYYCRFPKLYKLTIKYIHSIFYFFRPNTFR